MDNQVIEIPSEIKGYLESLIEDAGMTTLDDKMKEEMVMQLYERLDKFLTANIVNHLPSEYYDAFLKLNEEKRPKEEIESFLKDRMPNAEKVFAQAFIEFRNLYVGNASVAKSKPVSS